MYKYIGIDISIKWCMHRGIYINIERNTQKHIHKHNHICIYIQSHNNTDLKIDILINIGIDKYTYIYGNVFIYTELFINLKKYIFNYI